MKKKLFSKIRKRVLSVHGEVLKNTHKFKRINKLAGLINGMMIHQNCTMADLGSGLLQRITAHGKEKAAKTFLENSWNDYKTHYLPYMKRFLIEFIEHAQTRGTIYLVIDGSQMGNKHAALMVSMVYKNRGIPLCWTVKKGGKGHFTSKMHCELEEEVREHFGELFPKNKPVILLGDGEFDGTDLQDICKDAGWGYVFRTACNTVMYENGEAFKSQQLSTGIPHEGQDNIFIKNIEFTKERYRNVNFLYLHDRKYEKAIPLISNLDEPGDIIEAYDRRYSIECLFKDLKSTSFNLHKTRLKCAYAITNLIMVAAFAFTLLVKLGTKYENNSIRPYVQRMRPDQTVWSIYYFACALLVHLMWEGHDFEFSFQFSKFSMNSS